MDTNKKLKKMCRKTSVILGEHFAEFVEEKIQQDLFKSENEAKLDLLRMKLSVGETQLDQDRGVDGDVFMQELIE